MMKTKTVITPVMTGVVSPNLLFTTPGVGTAYT
jgi:hypothetical protein